MRSRYVFSEFHRASCRHVLYFIARLLIVVCMRLNKISSIDTIELYCFLQLRSFVWRKEKKEERQETMRQEVSMWFRFQFLYDIFLKLLFINTLRSRSNLHYLFIPSRDILGYIHPCLLFLRHAKMDSTYFTVSFNYAKMLLSKIMREINGKFKLLIEAYDMLCKFYIHFSWFLLQIENIENNYLNGKIKSKKQ